MVVGCEENLTEARMSSHASALLNTRGCSHSSEWKKLRGRVMYPFSIFADYRHFADSERKNREKGREMPWHFRIDVRVNMECASRRNLTNHSKSNKSVLPKGQKP